MSIIRTLVQTANGQLVVVDTAKVGKPLGMPYETMVFKANKDGSIKKGCKHLDVQTTFNQETALFEHEEMCKKWGKVTVV